MKVNIERILEIKEELRLINEHNLHDIDFYKDGKKLDIDSSIIGDFCYVGLNNVDFITSNYYMDGLN